MYNNPSTHVYTWLITFLAWYRRFNKRRGVELVLQAKHSLLVTRSVHGSVIHIRRRIWPVPHCITFVEWYDPFHICGLLYVSCVELSFGDYCGYNKKGIEIIHERIVNPSKNIFWLCMWRFVLLGLLCYL